MHALCAGKTKASCKEEATSQPASRVAPARFSELHAHVICTRSRRHTVALSFSLELPSSSSQNRASSSHNLVRCKPWIDLIQLVLTYDLIDSHMSNDTRQYGDLATQLVQESRRSTATDTLFKYNDPLVRSIVREQRDLESLLEPTLPPEPWEGDYADLEPHSLMYATAINRNKRCLLAYHTHRMDRLRDMYWACGGALPHLLGNAELRAKMSPSEVDFLREYNASIMEYRGDFSNELDITAGIEVPPKDLHAMVRVVKDCGVIQTELGTIDFKKGQRFMVRRSDIEHLIVQGYLEEL